MKDVWIGIGGLVAVVVVALGLAWVVQGSDFFLYRHFAPKYEQVRRDTFEQSKAYRQGMAQELENMRFEYVKATPSQKDALRSIILHRAADVDESALNSDLRGFIRDLREESK